MRTLEFTDNTLRLIDQTKLPHETAFVECRSAAEVASAIIEMRVRGAPAIGIAAAYGMALGAAALARDLGNEAPPLDFLAGLSEIAAQLRATRPTAVNLSWAIERCLAAARAAMSEGPRAAAKAIRRLADRLAAEDVATNQCLARLGATLVPDHAVILTHCNTGALATVDYGTALGVIRAAAEAGKQLHVFVDETRPYLQGARLTTWELQQLGIPCTLITDNMAGHFMARGAIDLVLVGADRIARNGDTANKIGTYTLAVLCRAHGLPFYVVAPTTSIDSAIASGQDIPIEERPAEEVTHVLGQRIAPLGVQAVHPAFDVTPAHLISAIVTEAGICWPPFESSLQAALAAPRPLGTTAGIPQ